MPITNNGGWVEDKDAFIFSGDDQKIFEVKPEEKSKAHFDQNNFGPIFGNDICIYTNSDENSDNNNYLGITYTMPENMNEDQSKCYFAGS